MSAGIISASIGKLAALRKLAALAALGFAAGGPGLAFAVEKPGFSTSGLIDLQINYSDSEHSWLRRGPDKLRFDETDEHLQLADLGIELQYTFDLRSEVKLQLHHYSDPERSVELTEAYWRYRTLGSGAWRSEFKVGAFYPNISLENIGPLWSSPYTLKPSAINTWIGEEVRVVGAEGRWTWVGDRAQSKHRVSFFGSIFGYNDPAGAMISWRGWSVHDRQTGLNGSLPMRDLPIVVLTDHSREFEPFMEIDDQPGIYGGVEWHYDRRLEVQFVYYDNRADDTLRQNDQYGWRTRFSQLSLHWRGEHGYEILSQHLMGNTIMVDGTVDNDFDSTYLMGVKSWGAHRIALRLERFRIKDLDGNWFDLNAEDGDSQTLSYSYLLRRHWKLSLEATRFFSRHLARLHFDEDVARSELQLTAGVRYYF